MKRNEFSPKALPTIPECEYVYHVVRRVSLEGKTKWIVRRARYSSYVLRLRHHGDDGMYFASEKVANDVRNVKELYQRNVYCL